MAPQTTAQWCLSGLGVALTGGFAVALAWAFESQSYNVWGSLLVAPAIVLANVILLWRLAKREDDTQVIKIMAWGLVLKLQGSLARYYSVFVMYDGVGDAASYNNYAVTYHRLWRQGQFFWEPSSKVGTQNLELITTAVYTVIGPAPLAGFLVFASFAYWGVYLMYRAFRIAVPGGNYRLYAALIFYLPSLLFWPSSIGKEAWLMLWLGVLTLGAAKLFADQPWAFTLLGLGVLGTSLVRPHITVLAIAALLVAQLFRPTANQAISVLYKVASVAVLAFATMILVTQSADFLGIDELTGRAVSDKIDWAGGQTGQGGSVFTPVPLGHPLGVPAAIVTLLFRPFPWEATAGSMLLQSIEGLFFVVLAIANRESLRQLPGMLRRNPFVVFAAIYSFAFILAFSGFANFGILARQRTLMIPLLLVLIALPAVRTAPFRGWRAPVGGSH